MGDKVKICAWPLRQHDDEVRTSVRCATSTEREVTSYKFTDEMVNEMVTRCHRVKGKPYSPVQVGDRFYMTFGVLFHLIEVTAIHAPDHYEFVRLDPVTGAQSNRVTHWPPRKS